MDDARAELDAIAALSAGRLRVRSFPTETAVSAADAIERFRRHHPGIVLHHEDAEPFETLARVRTRELHLAIAFDFDHWQGGTDYRGARIADEEELDWVDLFDDPFYLVLPEEHRLCQLDVVPITGLEGEPVFGVTPWRDDFAFPCRGAGFEPLRCLVSLDGLPCLPTLVATGRGATLMPGFSLTTVRSDLAVRPLDPPVVRHVRLELAHEVQSTPPAARIVRPSLAYRSAGQRAGAGPRDT